LNTGAGYDPERPWAVQTFCVATVLFNHLVGAAEKREREGKAERLGGLHVDDELNSRGLLDRRSAGLSPRQPNRTTMMN
jgi:hypothetical protein